MVTSASLLSSIDSNYALVSSGDPLPSLVGHNTTDVVLRAQAGDQFAFSELYKQYRKRVFCICIRMVHDLSLAEDLTQDVFFQVHRKLATFRGNSAFATWLHRLTVNIVLMHLRKRVLPLVSLDLMMTTIPEERVGRDFGALDRAQFGTVDRLAIDRAVAALAPGYRRVFLLHDVQGFQHREVAVILGCSLGNSKSQLHKARCALRDTLGASARLAATRAKTLQ
jgi:RNA polymerase sigma-70 factor (ECF subfamily)